MFVHVFKGVIGRGLEDGRGQSRGKRVEGEEESENVKFNHCRLNLNCSDGHNPKGLIATNAFNYLMNH